MTVERSAADTVFQSVDVLQHAETGQVPGCGLAVTEPGGFDRTGRGRRSGAVADGMVAALHGERLSRTNDAVLERVKAAAASGLREMLYEEADDESGTRR